jgi:ketosteroid isomerase-like protein
MSADPAQDVLAAARTLVEVFAAHRRDDYFACFAPDATFVFYTTPDMLSSRAEWEREWDRLEREDGFRVLACESSAQAVQVLGDAAVFRHAVRTRARLGGAETEIEERETIVFRREPDGRWLVVHEHLSPRP